MTDFTAKIFVHATWDEEACVWVATSDDVPGLVAEAETAEKLEDKLKVLIPEMLLENGLLNPSEHQDIPFHLQADRDSITHCC